MITQIEEPNKVMAVAAIENGTVIDHINQGKAFLLLKLLKIHQSPNQITVGLNLPSSRLKEKDIIKMTDRELSAEESAQIAVFSPHATINIIQNYRIVKKFTVALPNTLAHLLICPNPNCITNHEATSRLFFVKHKPKESELQCSFCENCYPHHEITHYTIE